jgi:hypothetical protein
MLMVLLKWPSSAFEVTIHINLKFAYPAAAVRVAVVGAGNIVILCIKGACRVVNIIMALRSELSYVSYSYAP